MIKQLKMRKDSQTMLSIESSVNDVLSIVLTIALVQAYSLGEFQFGPVAGNLVASFLVAMVFGVVGALIWSRLLNRIHAIKNTMFTTAAFVFVLFGLVEVLGFNGGIAALVFGITIGNVESIRFYVFRRPQSKDEEAAAVGLSEAERAFFSEVAFLLKTFFFVYLGMSLEFISGWLVQLSLIVTGIVFLLRIPAVKLTVSRALPVKDASIMAIMVPKGLAAAVLASIPLQQEVAGGELIRSVTYGVILLSIVMTSVLLLLMEKAGLSAVYGWIMSLNVRKVAGYFQNAAEFSGSKLSAYQEHVSTWDLSGLPERLKGFSSEARSRVRAFFYEVGKPEEYSSRIKDKGKKPKE